MVRERGHTGFGLWRLGWRTTLFVTTALALVTPQSVKAQSEPLGEIVVKGERDPYASGKAIESKRDADIISDGISDSQVSNVPVFALGDALAAIPGVSFVANDGQGEDEFMTVRGLNPDYNTVTIDGMQLPSTEETTRALAFDVFPAFLASQATVQKTWTADQPSDAIGAVTNLKTRSAFDNPGPYIVGHVDAAYWDQPQQIRRNNPSGAADVVVSDTFGPADEFGVLAMGSYYNRSSNTTNITTSNYAFYPPSPIPATNVLGLNQTSKNALSETLLPSQNTAGLLAVPQTHQWYYYDNERQRTGAFLRFDFDDHTMWHATASGGYFDSDGQFYRNYQYIAGEGPANIQTPATGSWGEGVAGLSYDHFHDVRQVYYVDLKGGVDFNTVTHLDLNANYGIGHYRQDGTDSPFSTALSTSLAPTYNLAAPGAPLLTAGSAYMNPALYNQSVYELETDESINKLPQIRLDFKYNFDADNMGFGYSAGTAYRDLAQQYVYYRTVLNPIVPTTLATIGTLDKNVSLANGEGQTLLLQDPAAVAAYVSAHPGNYVRNSGDVQANILNNYFLNEAIADGYMQARYRGEQFTLLIGVREEWTREAVDNYLPSPFNSTTNFVKNATVQDYLKLLPSLNASYKPVEDVILRTAVTRDLARPQYAQLGENSSASLVTSTVGGTASQTIANPHLLPREATNYDLSVEYYPAQGMLASVAVFDKEISHEILALTNTQLNATVPGYNLPVALTTTTYKNADNSSVRGIEFNLIDAHFDFLPGALSGLGFRGNAAFMDFDAPHLLMSDGTLRRLPQLLSTSKSVANAALIYSYESFHGELAYNHTGKQPLSFSTQNGANDFWWNNVDTIDVQIGYEITPNLDFRFQVKNLTDATWQKVTGANENLNISLEQNGRAYYAGIAFHY